MSIWVLADSPWMCKFIFSFQFRGWRGGVHFERSIEEVLWLNFNYPNFKVHYNTQGKCPLTTKQSLHQHTQHPNSNNSYWEGLSSNYIVVCLDMLYSAWIHYFIIHSVYPSGARILIWMKFVPYSVYCLRNPLYFICLIHIWVTPPSERYF